MTIKEVEKLVGMTSANIRYYEKEGLLTPERNSSNNYRNYSECDVENLKKIKVLRVLGISIQEIHEIIEGDSALYDVLEHRLAELKEETRRIEEIEKTCQYIMVHHMDYESMDSSVLDEKAATLKDIISEVLRKDTLEEHITGKQLNSTIGIMMIYGWGISAAISLLFGDYFRGESFTWLLGMWIAVSFLIGLVVYGTSNAAILMIIFQVLTLMMAPALNVLAYFLGEPVTHIPSEHIAIVLFLIAGFVIAAALIGKVNERFYRRYGKMALLSLGYSAMSIVTLYFSITELKTFLILAVITLVANLLIGSGWVTANLERTEYSRYYAIVCAITMINFVAMFMNQSGRNRSFGRWKDNE